MEILKLNAPCKDYIWGGNRLREEYGKVSDADKIAESWELSCHKDGQSVIANGKDKGKTLSEYVAENKNALGTACDRFEYFPILIKLIDAKDNLSVQVHPDNDYAMRVEGEYGKTEMWYVVDADKGAKLRSGFSEQITPKEYKERVLNNTITDVLQEYEIHPGDVFFLPAGRVHSIGAGSFIAEIQQTSDITYRIYDFNRKDANGKTRELHTDLAREAINYEVLDDYRTKYEPLKDEPVELVACPYFTTSLYDMTEEISCDYSELDSFVIFICMEGSCVMKDNEGNELTVNAGESILLPATTQDVTITPVGGNVKLLETYV
mgnify:CR=1 FL=1